MKRSVEELAVMAGRPAFAEPVYVGRPNVGNQRHFLKLARSVLESGRLSNNGSMVRELEERFADLVGVKHCIMVCNATIGLQTAIRALGLTGEVIVPSFTFIATAHALRWQRIRPVFCDIDPDTHCIDPCEVERLITPRTTGILGVHVWGNTCDTDALQRVADRHGIALMFDAAHAVGCAHRGRMIGGFGQAEVFSFHATKLVNSFEGGAITTNSDDLASRMRLMCNFGIASQDTAGSVGTNAKMHEVSAAMGLVNLDSIDEFVSANRANYECYAGNLRGVPGISLLPSIKDECRSYHYVVALVDEAVAGIGRDDLMAALHAENVIVRRYFHPGCHNMEPYASDLQVAALPVTEQVCRQVLVLPTGVSTSLSDVQTICGLIRLIVKNGDIVRRRMQPETDIPLANAKVALVASN